MAKIIIQAEDDKWFGTTTIAAASGWGETLEKYFSDILNQLEAALHHDRLIGMGVGDSPISIYAAEGTSPATWHPSVKPVFEGTTIPDAVDKPMAITKLPDEPPLVKEADPELERLLAEEEEIEARHREEIAGRPADDSSSFWSWGDVF